MTRIPSLDHAIVDDRKLADYLLSLAHSFGQAKARFLLALGFRRDDLEGLCRALLDHAAASPAVTSRETEFGAKYVVEGPLTAPGGGAAIVRSIWCVERGSTAPRRVTVYPWKGERP